MNSNHPSVTIGFIARERFSLAAKALRTLFDHTTIPFRLIIVDSNVPERYRKQMDQVVQGRENVTYLDIDHDVMPNYAKNRVYEASGDDYICFLENDCIVPAGWLSGLVDACQRFPAKVASPLLFDRHPRKGRIHHAWKLGSIKLEHETGIEKIRLVPHGGVTRTWNQRTDPFRADFIEGHCVLYHRSALEQLYPLNENLNIDEFVDNALTLHKLGIDSIIVPSVKVGFYAPGCVRKDELPYFRFRWDIDTAAKAKSYLTDKWNIINFGNPEAFCRERLTYYTDFTRHWIYRFKGAWQRRVVRNIRSLMHRGA